MIQQRKKRNSSKVNLIISVVFHSILVGIVFYFAAKEGLLGKKMKELAVTMVKEKKVEQAKVKPEEPKVNQQKPEEAKAAVPQPKAETAAAPPPAASDATPTVAPAASALPSFDFSDGAHQVESISDPNTIYKTLVEHMLYSRWNRPEDMADEDFTAEVELTVDKDGTVRNSAWMKGSGDARWDKTVKEAVAQVKVISRPPPKGFPEKFLVRFYVDVAKTDSISLN